MKKCVRLFFTGDFVHTHLRKNQILFSDELQEMLHSCDICCCNFEAPLAVGKPKKKIGLNNINNINSVNILSEAGFDVIALANNHIFDYGLSGMRATIHAFREHNINVIGAGEGRAIYNPFIFKKGGLTIGILNMSENGFGAAVEDRPYGYAYLFHSSIQAMIPRMKQECDYVIAVCHAGAEKWDIPLPEIRESYKHLVDLGVSAVIAHHPHVPQGWEEYKGAPIFYSLGNFVFDKGKGSLFPNSYCVLLKVSANKDCNYQIIPTFYNGKDVIIDRDENRISHIYRCKEQLDDPDMYMKQIDANCLEAYTSIYMNSYKRIVVFI